MKRTKRFLCFALVVVMMISLMPVGAFAADVVAEGTCGYDLTWSLDREGMLTIDGSGEMYDYQSPQKVPWDAYRQSIGAVVIGEGVTSIGSYAFYDCDRLISVTPYGYRTSIGNYAFYDCDKLEMALFPGRTSVGNYAFSGCVSLKTVSIIPKSIGDYAFSYCESLESVYLCDYLLTSVTVSSSAFNGVNAKVYYPEYSSISIGYKNAFGKNMIFEEADHGYYGNTYWKYDAAAKKLTISGVGPVAKVYSGQDTPWYVYSNRAPEDKQVKTIEVLPGITEIPSYCFEYMKSVEEIILPEGIKIFAPNSCNDCSLLNNLVIPSTVESFVSGSYFNRCDSLTDIFYVGTQEEWNKIPNAAQDLSLYTNAKVNFLKYNEQPATCTESGYEGYYAFDSSVVTNKYDANRNPITEIKTIAPLGHDYADGVCTRCGVSDYVAKGTCGENLTWTLDSDGLLTISGTGSMKDYYDTYDSTHDLYRTSAPWGSYYSSIESVVINSGVTSIGDDAFYNCSKLASVTIPDTVTDIGLQAFCYCSFESVTIPDSVTSIDNDAFHYCTELTSVTIPASVTNLGLSVFAGCTKLNNISVASGNKNFTSADGVLLTKDEKTLHDYPAGRSGAYTIPDGITSIEGRAFNDCSGLTSVMIPASVTSIGSNAFRSCTALESATFEGNAPTTFGSIVFYNCATGFKILAPENNDTWLGEAYDAEAGTWNGYPIEFYSVGPAIIADGECGEKLTWTLDENGLLTISGTGAMADYSYTKSAPWYSLKDDISSIVISKGVTGIGNYAFQWCDELADVTISDSVTSIGVYAFQGCMNLSEVRIPDGVTRIKEQTFSFCDGLASVTIPSGVTSIDKSAFEGCSSLASVTIGNAVTSIGKSAFSFCDGLEKVFFAGNESDWNNISVEADNNCLTAAFIHYNAADPATHYTVTETAPTCTQAGGIIYTCPCGDSYGEIIPALGHDYDENGVCTRCGLREGYVALGETDISIPAGETVYSKFAPEKSGFFCFTTTGNDDTYGYLFDSDGEQITENDDDGEDHNFKITYYLEKGKEYSVGIRTYNGSEALVGLSVSMEKTSGRCGENLTWSIENDVLTISGTGEMWNYDQSSLPDSWFTYGYSDFIEAIEIDDGVTSIGIDAFRYFYNLKDVVIPDSVKSIGAWAFQGCNSLEDIYIGSGLEECGYRAFTGCGNLSSITVSYKNEEFASKDGMLFNKSMTELIRCPEGKRDVCIIPEGVDSIAEFALENCGISDVVIPQSVTSIGSDAFANCSRITSVTIPAQVTLIDDYAFSDCSSLLSAVFEGNAPSIIGDEIFGDADDAFTVCAPANNSTWTDSKLYDAEAGTWNGYPIEFYGSALPAITSQPTDAVVHLNEIASFSVSASGENLSYRWQVSQDGGKTWSYTSMAGYSTPTLNVEAKSYREGYLYRCVITDGNGYVLTSDAATMQFLPCEAAIITQPEDFAGGSREKAHFSVVAEGEDLKYQWYFSNDGGNKWGKSYASGSTESVFEPTLYADISGRYFRCEITDKYGQVMYTDAVKMYIDFSNVTIISQPVSYTGKANDLALFTVVAEATNLEYQWEVSQDGGKTWAKTTNDGWYCDTLQVRLYAYRDGYMYRCKLTSGSPYDAVNSTVVYSDIVTIHKIPQTVKIESNPETAYCEIGETAVFTVNATGNGLTYQWQFSSNGGASWGNSGMTGAKTATLYVPATAARNGQLYRCVVTDDSDSYQTSGYADLKVGVKPVIVEQPHDYVGELKSSAVFKVDAEGKGLTYQWYYLKPGSSGWAKSGQADATSDTFTVVAEGYRDGYQYRCEIVNADGMKITTVPVTLRIG